MLLFAPPEFESVASALRERVSQLWPGQYQAGRFDNGELKIDIETAVKAKRCFVLGSIAPPDARLLSTLLLAHTLRKDGPLEITGILPYLAYSRQDRDTAFEVARCAEERGLTEDFILPAMDDVQVVARVAATALKAQEQGLSTAKRTHEEYIEPATRRILRSRNISRIMASDDMAEHFSADAL